MTLGINRGLALLLASAAAGALVWSATQGSLGGQSAYWSAVGLIVVAGAVFALAQAVAVRGERPNFALGSFLLGFLPVLVVAGWIVSAGAPGGSYASHFQTWSADIHVSRFVTDMQSLWPLLAFAIGLTLGLSFRSVGAVATVADYERDVAAYEPAYEPATVGGSDTGFDPKPVNEAPVAQASVIDAPAASADVAAVPLNDDDVAANDPARRGLLGRFRRAELRRERVVE